VEVPDVRDLSTALPDINLKSVTLSSLLSDDDETVLTLNRLIGAAVEASPITALGNIDNDDDNISISPRRSSESSYIMYLVLKGSI
jgi:hypothetical protein